MPVSSVNMTTPGQQGNDRRRIEFLNTNPSEREEGQKIMNQPLLFQDPNADYPHTPAATHDDTSQRAAKDMAPKAHTIREAVLKTIKHEPVTVHECAARLNMPVATVQPRFSELRKMGMIEDGGDRRLNQASGKRAIVWQPVCDTHAGLPKAYREMLAREEKRKNERRGVLA